MLEIKNVSKYYGDLLAVDNLSLEVKAGTIFGLLGSNGAGKTTTFKMIMGLLKPTSGEIYFNGKEVDLSLTEEIGYLIEERSLMPKLTVKEQLYYVGKLKNMSNELINERIIECLVEFNILEYKDKKIKELSKGNQQKVQFISAILNKPKLLILDEPFSGLDPFNVDLFVKTLKNFQDNGAIIFLSSHQMSYVEKFCENLCVLQKGKVVLQGNIEDIKEEQQKKVIKIKADIDTELVKKINGVIDVYSDKLYNYVVVSQKDYIKSVFDYIKTLDVVENFEVEIPSLHEIFVEKVGASYEG